MVYQSSSWDISTNATHLKSDDSMFLWTSTTTNSALPPLDDNDDVLELDNDDVCYKSIKNYIKIRNKI